MRFTSLVVELIRARAAAAWSGSWRWPRPRLWLILPMLLLLQPARRRRDRAGFRLGIPGRNPARSAAGVSGSPPSPSAPPATACSALACWRRPAPSSPSGSIYQLARAIVGGQQAVLAVLLSLTVVAFSSPGVEFGPLVLARSLRALLLAAFLAIDRPEPAQCVVRLVDRGGLLLLTTPAAPWHAAARSSDLLLPPSAGGAC